MGYCRTIIGLLFWFVVTISVAHAVDLQFRLSDGHLTGEPSDVPIESAEGYGIVTLIGSAADVIFPVPIGQPAASSCGTGQWDWTRITDPGVVTLAGAGMEVIPGLLLFKTTSTLLTGCYQVSSWHDLRNLYRATIGVGVLGPDQALLEAINDVQMWIQRICPGTTGGANCNTARNNMLQMDQDYRGSGQAATLTTQMVVLRNDVYGFKASQGW